MDKKNYIKPSMLVVKRQRPATLLSGSGPVPDPVPGGGGEGAARRFNFVEDENDPYPTN